VEGGLAALAISCVAACGGEEGSAADLPDGCDPVISKIGAHSVDVGLDDPVEVPADTPLKIAFLFSAIANTYQEAMADEVRTWGKDNCVEIDIREAQFDGQRQADQVETALETGDYNAWYLTPIDGDLLCNTLTKDAPAKDILVIIQHISICGTNDLPASGQWVPGLVSYVGAEETQDFLANWIDGIRQDREGQESRVLVLEGPAGITLSSNMDRGLQAAEAKDPNFHVVATVNTDFSTVDAQAKAETLLQAHPDANVIVSAFSDMSLGILNAIEDKGMSGKVAVYDIGAGTDTIDLIENGSIRGSLVFSPRTYATTSLDALKQVWETGEMPDKFLPALSQGTMDEPFIVTKENLSEYTPEY